MRRPVLPDHRGGTNIVAAVILGGHSLLILLGQQQAVRLREGEPPAKPQGAFHLADNPVQRPVRNLQTIKARPPRRRRKGDRAPVRKAYRRFAGAVGLIGDIPRSLQRSGVKVGGRQKDLLDRLLRTGLLGQVGGVIVRPGRRCMLDGAFRRGRETGGNRQRQSRAQRAQAAYPGSSFQRIHGIFTPFPR